MQIENLNGKAFVFKIQLNDYNLKYRWEFYTIKKVFDFFVGIDKAIQLDKMTKVHIFLIQKITNLIFNFYML